MTISIPSIYRQLHPESMQRSVREILEVCNTARAHAILGGSITELTINTRSRTLSVGAAAASGARSGGGIEFVEGPRNTLESKNVSGEDWRMEDYSGQGLRSSSGSGTTPEGAITSTQLPEGVQIEGIRLNFLDYTEDEIVRVRFYPNGTSDEFSLFLVSEKGERRQIYLEVVTGLADVETDPMKFR
jgi:hypothetical protein